ncbi:MAG: type III-A CRISPR-associated RAMP protein Csm5, partial [Persephonella sp.]
IHIGTGNEINKFEYILDGRTLKIYSLDKLISLLNEKEIEDLIIDMEKGNRIDENLIRRHLNFIEKYSLPVSEEIKFLSKNKTIQEFIKFIDNGEYKPYIPASEIKGAVRTAILYKVLKDNWDNLKNTILKGKKINGELKFELKEKSTKTLENTIFFFKYSNTYIDIMKVFNVCDAYPEGDINLILKELSIFNSKRLKGKTEYAECLPKDITFNSEIEINKGLLGKYKNYPYKNYVLDWKKCCYEYANDLIEMEKDYWKNKNSNIYDFLEELKVRNTEEEPLTRLGRYTGKLSHTILVVLREKIKDLDKNLLNYKEVFPKTRRITTRNELLGWVRLENFTEKNKNEVKSFSKEELKKLLSKKFKVR